MKKVFTSTLLFLTLALTAAQAQICERGYNIFSAGLGWGSSLAVGTTCKTPLFSLQYERGLWEISQSGTISLGGYVGYNQYALGVDKFSYTIVGLRSAYHLNDVNSGNIDLYGGMMIAYDFRNAPSNSFHAHYLGLSGADVYHNKLDFMPYMGARLFLNDHLAAFTEISYGTSFLTIGMAWAQ